MPVHKPSPESPATKPPAKPVSLTLTIPHALGAGEVRRRLNLHTDWAFAQFAKEKIAIEADDWFGNRRAFSATGHGLRAAAAIQVGEDTLHVEALMPEAVGLFAPVIEVIGRHYARRLLSDEGAALEAVP